MSSTSKPSWVERPDAAPEDAKMWNSVVPQTYRSPPGDRPDEADRGRQIRRADGGPSGAREPPVGEREREVQRERDRNRRRGVGDAARKRRRVAERRQVLPEPHAGQRQQQQRDRDPSREQRRDDHGRAGDDAEHLRSARRVATKDYVRNNWRPSHQSVSAAGQA